jgi:uncharacterized phage protein gp47/JayE
MKTMETIYGEMLEQFEQATGFTMADESDLAVRLYAAAAQLESLYVYADWCRRQCFPQTAEGTYLAYHGALRGLERKPGTQAVGKLRFSMTAARDEALTVKAGVVCTTAGLVRFELTEDVVIPAGQKWADGAAQAQEAGTGGNVAAGTVTFMTQAPVGIAAVTNPIAFSGGAAAESDEQFRARILDSFIRLPNGANAAFYENRVLAMDGVGAVQVIPRINGVGTVGVVVSTESGEADDDLVTRVREDLEAVREIAVDVTVLAPTVQTVDIAATLWPQDGSTYDEAAAAVELAIRNHFTGAQLGKDVYLAQLGCLIYDTGLVANYRITSPAADQTMTAYDLPRLGTLTLTEGT